MTERTCPSCRRRYATPADWAAFEADPYCNNEDCTWGGDRCWYTTACGYSSESVAELAAHGKALRAGRPLGRVPHPANCGGLPCRT